MTNKELKRKSFLEATKRLEEKKRLTKEKTLQEPLMKPAKSAGTNTSKGAARNERLYNIKKTWQA